MIPQSEFKSRRSELMRQMKDGVALLVSAPAAVRNHDVEHEYRQDSNFYYFTGFKEPESACLLVPGAKKDKFILFVRPREREREIWTGYRSGVEGAVNDYGADKAYPIEELPKKLEEYLAGAKMLYYTLGVRPELDKMINEELNRLRAHVRSGASWPTEFRDPSALASEMRLRKSPAEIETLRAACDASALAHEMAMRATRPGMNEYEVDAVLKYFFRKSGSERLGYPTIVASGPNTATLHYNENNRSMKAGELLLIDAGTEIDYMTADITRTFPVSGRFSPEQKKVYEIVLEAQEAATKKVRPGVTFYEVHEAAIQQLTEGLKQLGVLTGPIKKLIEKKEYAHFYMHRTSHWLGMDVHDAGAYQVGGKPRKLEPGMVLTVEPGLYFREDEKLSPRALRGIGVRIEDDVLVTPAGCEVLSHKAPKSVSQIERLTGSGVVI